MMRAVLARSAGGPDVLDIVTVHKPEPGAGEVLLQVVAAGVNRADAMQREGRYDPPPGVTAVLGLECAGRIVAVGEGVSDGYLGEQACALVAGGAYAEFVTVPIGQTAPLPVGIAVTDAAGVPEVAATVWSNLVERGGLTAGERVLIHGGASGIGAMAIQVAKAVGAEVIVTVSSSEKAEFCTALGAAEAIVYRTHDFEVALNRESGNAGIDVVVDIVGAPYLSRNLAVLRRGGRLIQIGLLGGALADLDLGQVLARDLTITGSGLRTRPPAEKARLMSAVVAGLWPMFADGRVRTTTQRIVPFTEVREAHRALDERGHQGKIVLSVDSSE